MSEACKTVWVHSARAMRAPRGDCSSGMLNSRMTTATYQGGRLSIRWLMISRSGWTRSPPRRIRPMCSTRCSSGLQDERVTCHVLAS